MKELTIIEKAVLELIPLGEGRKVSISYISSLVDIDSRSIYTIINNLRKKVCLFVPHDREKIGGIMWPPARKKKKEGLLRIGLNMKIWGN